VSLRSVGTGLRDTCSRPYSAGRAWIVCYAPGPRHFSSPRASNIRATTPMTVRYFELSAFYSEIQAASAALFVVAKRRRSTGGVLAPRIQRVGGDGNCHQCGAFASDRQHVRPVSGRPDDL
jgi:hypothetical protein